MDNGQMTNKINVWATEMQISLLLKVQVKLGIKNINTSNIRQSSDQLILLPAAARVFVVTGFT